MNFLFKKLTWQVNYLVKQNILIKAIKLITYLMPVALLLWYVSSFSTNVPYWDQWEIVDFFDQIATGKANFWDFFSLYNEHRIFFPRIIFAILAFPSKWNIKLEIYFSIILAGLTYWMIYKLAKASSKNSIKLFDLFAF